jgi:hypothetical protein
LRGANIASDFKTVMETYIEQRFGAGRDSYVRGEVKIELEAAE